MGLRTAWRTGLAGLVVGMSLSAAAMAATSPPDPGGFIAELQPTPAASGTMPLLALARTHSGPGDVRAERDAGTDWRLAWIDADGRTIEVMAVPDPMRALHGSVDPNQPVLVRFVDHSGAVMAELRDAQGQLRGEIPLDAQTRAAAAARQAATATRLAQAGRLAQKRARDPAVIAADARRRLDFQLDVQARLRDRRAERCASPAQAWRVPEQVPAADACQAAAPPSAAARPTPPAHVARTAPGALAVPSAPTPVRQVRPLPKRGDRLQDVRLRGKILFPAGSAAPTSAVRVTTWGAPGPNSGYVLDATAPGFGFDSPAVDGAVVDIDVMPPAPFLPRVQRVGPLTADSYHEILLSRGVVVSGRLLFPAGSTPPTAQVSAYYIDSLGWHHFFIQPPQFAYQIAVTPGSEVSVGVQPPAPLLEQRVDLGVVSADTTRDLTLVQGVILGGRILFPEGSAAPTSFVGLSVSGFLGDPEASRYVFAHPPGFNWQVVVPPGSDVRAAVQPPPPFLSETKALGVVDADASRDILLRRGAVVSGRVLFPRGTPAPTASMWMLVWDYEAGRQGYGRSVQVSAPDFTYATVVEPGASPRLQLEPPTPFLETSLPLGRVDADRNQDLKVQRGVLVRGRVTGGSNYSVTVGDRDTGSSSIQFFGAPETFDVAAVARTGTVEVAKQGMFPVRAYRTGTQGDVEVPFRLERRPAAANVVVHVRGPDGQGMPSASVEYWRDGRYFASSLTQAQGRAQAELPEGVYEVRVWPDSQQRGEQDWDNTFLFAEPVIRAALSVAGATEQTFQASADAWADMRVALPTEAPWPGCGNIKDGRLELLRGGKVVARSRAGSRYPGADNLHRVVTGAGTYVLRYRMPGGVSYASEPFVASAGRTLALAREGTAPQRLWTGTLRSHDGVPVPQRMIGVSDELGIRTSPSCSVASDAAGRFRLPLCEGCVYEFRASSTSPSQRRIVTIDHPVTGNLEQDLRLDPPLPFRAMADTGTSRILGDGSEPFRLVFVAEGYAAERETYTDSNGNGMWDGVQFVDVNGNGLWEQTEPAATYGNAPYPTAGLDPRLGNEAFQDLNGDGVLSLDDRALFERNVRDYLRGLFSSDQFSAYREAYQASAAMTYSAQVGMDHGANWQRDTVFDAGFQPNRGLVEIDYGTASAAAALASPGYTVVVVMINQPVPYGRVNSFILASGGMLSGNVNDTVAGGIL